MNLSHKALLSLLIIVPLHHVNASSPPSGVKGVYAGMMEVAATRKSDDIDIDADTEKLGASIKDNKITDALSFLHEVSSRRLHALNAPTHSFDKIADAFLKVITKENIRVCQNKCSLALGEVLVHTKKKLKDPPVNLTGKQSMLIMNGMQKLCYNTHISDYVKEKDCTKKAFESFLGSMPPDLVQSYGHLYLEHLLADGDEYLTDAVLDVILAAPKNCAHLKTPEKIKYVMTLPKSSQRLSGECFAKLPAEPVALIEPPKKYKPPNTLTTHLQMSLHPSFVDVLTPVNIQEYAVKIDKVLMPGKDLDTTKMTKNIKNLKIDTLVGKLNSSNFSSASTDTLRLFSADETTKKDRAASVNSQLLEPEMLREDDVTALRHLHDEDLKGFPSSVIQALVDKHPIACSRLPSGINYDKINISNAECFWYMDAGTQAVVFSTANSLHDEVLKRVSKENIGNWKIGGTDHPNTASSGASGNEKQGIEAFNFLKKTKHSNMLEIISHLGEDPDGENPCELFEFETVNDSVFWSDNISTKCYLTKPKNPDTSPKDFKMKDRLKLLQPFHALKKNSKTFTEMTDVGLRNLISGGIFCGSADEDTFKLIPPAALKSMTGRCFSQLLFRDKLTSAQIAAFPTTVFEDVPASKLSPAVIKAMSKEQFVHACTKAKEAGQNNIAVALTADVISSLEESVLTAITSEQWGEVPVDAYKGISDKIFHAIPAAATKHIKVKQVEAIPTDAFAGMTVEQAKEIGSSTAPHDQPFLLQYLAKIAEISDEAHDAINERLPEGSRVSRGGWLMYIFIGGGVLVGLAVIGGIVFYFVRQQ